MADAKIFRLQKGSDLEALGRALTSYLRVQKGLEADGISGGKEYFIQARQTEEWKKLVGMDRAIQVRLVMYDDAMVTVNIGAGKWVDKLGAAVVGNFLFAPLLFTAAIGAWEQARLPEEIFSFVEQYALSDGKPGRTCEDCGQAIPKGARFCPHCGQPVPAVCPSCGKAAQPGAKFCTGCGTALV